MHKFRLSWLDRNEFPMNGGLEMVNPSSRQIYLTFPADSTFREGDVSNYSSIYGPIQDVRILYQQKRMFGFVTFVYPETVKLIIAKGNPHFVCVMLGYKHSRVFFVNVNGKLQEAAASAATNGEMRVLSMSKDVWRYYPRHIVEKETREFEARWIGWAGVNVPDEAGQRALTKALAEKVQSFSYNLCTLV
ncbi:hypothetical protein ACSBR1_014467 [Camellia fascicularis]